jgi:hypothetical protein
MGLIGNIVDFRIQIAEKLVKDQGEKSLLTFLKSYPIIDGFENNEEKPSVQPIKFNRVLMGKKLDCFIDSDI